MGWIEANYLFALRERNQIATFVLYCIIVIVNNKIIIYLYRCTTFAYCFDSEIESPTLYYGYIMCLKALKLLKCFLLYLLCKLLKKYLINCFLYVCNSL